MKHQQHSDYANTDNPSYGADNAASRYAKHAIVFQINAQGFAYGRVIVRRNTPEQGKRFIQAMNRLHRTQEQPEIVMPRADWPVDADGRGWTEMEVMGATALKRVEQQIADEVEANRASVPVAA